MVTSDKGRAFIRKEEGERLTAYQDIAGIWTIGVGCTGPDIVEGLTITADQADQMFAARLAKEFEPGVNSLLGDAATTQSQFDAMVSLAFNIGVGAFSHSSVLREHMAGDYNNAANSFLMWDKVHEDGKLVVSRELHERRLEESDIYMSEVNDNDAA